MNNRENLELILMYGECHRSSRQAAQMYVDKYPDKFHPTHSYVHRLLRGLNEHGQFPDNQNEQQQSRPNCSDEDIQLQVMTYVCLFLIIKNTCISKNGYISRCST